MPEPMIIIDDADPAVVYSNSPAWIFDRFDGPVGRTRHGAVHAGQTVSVKFHGKSIYYSLRFFKPFNRLNVAQELAFRSSASLRT